MSGYVKPDHAEVVERLFLAGGVECLRSHYRVVLARAEDATQYDSSGLYDAGYWLERVERIKVFLIELENADG